MADERTSYPKKLYVKREGDGEYTYLTMSEDLSEYDDGDEVAVYEVKETKTVSVKTTRRLR